MIPTLTLDSVIGACIGLAAHILWGGDGRRLVYFVVASVAGFLIGEVAGDILSIHLFTVGPANLLTGILGALVASTTAAILTGRSRNSN